MKKETSVHNTNSIGNQYILFSGTMLDINYVARTSTAGREFDMVMNYVDFLIRKYEKQKRKKAVIFIEPQLDTGYPDVVIVEYSSTPELKWTASRNSLSPADIKILFYIQTHGRCTLCDLESKLGFSKEAIHKTTLKLSKCGLIHLYPKSNSVRAVQLKSYCRISKIISIEAKIDKWSEAIRQAGNNIWFSTESYILMNKDSCSDSIQTACREQGLGIILVNGAPKTILSSSQRDFPVSYASLQFNEWILRYLNM